MATIPGSAGDDVLFGTADTDVITGEAGNDVLLGLAGDDAINGGTGSDIIIGGPGSDTLVGGDTDVFIWNNGDGSDLIDGSAGTDVQIVNGGATADAMRVDADVGDNTVFQRTSPGPFTLTMNNVETLDVRGLGGADTFLVGNLTATDVTQVVFRGGTGNDSLDGGTSQTAIVAYGEEGNDTLGGGLGNDVIDGGTGVDTVIYTGGVDTVLIELADIVSAPSVQAHATFGAGSLVLDFGAGNILSLEWLPGAFTAEQYYNASLQNVILV